MRHIWEGGMAYYRPPFYIWGDVSPVPSGIYAPAVMCSVNTNLILFGSLITFHFITVHVFTVAYI